MKGKGPTEITDTCSIQSLSMIGGSSLASMILPSFMIKNEKIVSLRYIKDVVINSYEHYDSETGEVSFEYGLEFEQDKKLILKDMEDKKYV